MTEESTPEIFWVQPWDVPRVWSQVAPIISKAIEKSNGEFTLDTIWGRLMRNQEILIVISENGKIKGALTVFVSSQENKRSLFVRILAGEQFASWSHFEKDIEDYARQLNCQSIETHAVPGMSRLARNNSLTMT